MTSEQRYTEACRAALQEALPSWQFPAKDVVQHSHIHHKTMRQQPPDPFEFFKDFEHLDETIGYLLDRTSDDFLTHRLEELGIDSLEQPPLHIPTYDEVWRDAPIEAVRHATQRTIDECASYMSAYSKHRAFEARQGDELLSPSGKPYKFSETISRSARAPVTSFRMSVGADTTSRPGPSREELRPPSQQTARRRRKSAALGWTPGSPEATATLASLNASLASQRSRRSPAKGAIAPVSSSPAAMASTTAWATSPSRTSRTTSAQNARADIGGRTQEQLDTDLLRFFLSRGLRPPCSILPSEARADLLVGLDLKRLSKSVRKEKQIIADREAAEELNNKHRQAAEKAAQEALSEQASKSRAVVTSRQLEEERASTSVAAHQGARRASAAWLTSDPEKKSAVDLMKILDMTGIEARVV